MAQKKRTPRTPRTRKTQHATTTAKPSSSRRQPLAYYDEFGFNPMKAEELRNLIEFLYHRWWRVKTEGVQHVPSRGRVIIVANHAGFIPFDGLVIKHAVEEAYPGERPLRPLIENPIYYLPFIGTIFQRLGCVRADQENAERLLNSDFGIIVFPEGIKGISKPYKERYNLQRFGRGGFVRLAIKTRSPIVPAAIVGSEETYPLLRTLKLPARVLNLPFFPVTPFFPLFGLAGLLPLPSRWFVQFGEPVDTSRYPQNAAEDDILVNELTERVRSTIQKMVYHLLSQRRSVWFG